MLQLVAALATAPEYHNHHFISTRLTMRLLDVLHSMADPTVLGLLVERGRSLLYTLHTLEGEYSRPFVRSVLAASTCWRASIAPPLSGQP